MHRSKIRGADIVGDPAQYNRINAEKCIKYLRGIGVEVDDAAADSWMDTQAAHRFLASEKNSAVTVGQWECHECGGDQYYVAEKRGAKGHRLISAACSQCGSKFWHYRLLMVELRDGTLKDYREYHYWKADQAGGALPLAAEYARILREIDKLTRAA